MKNGIFKFVQIHNVMKHFLYHLNIKDSNVYGVQLEKFASGYRLAADVSKPYVQPNLIDDK